MSRPEEDIPPDWSTLVRLGTVTAVDLAAARCVVRFGDPDDDDGGTETPPIRWLMFRAGKTRVWSPPSVGEQVILLTPDGQLAAAIAVTGIDQDAFPPAGDTLTELIAFEDGARIGYDPEGHALTAILPAGATAEIEAPGGITLRGPVSIEGDVSVTGAIEASGDVTGNGTSLHTHKHGGVQAGGGETGAPV